MNDSSTESGAVESERPPHLALAERLLRRHAEPLGVIDVRRPQQLHERTAGWVARRFALLDHWRTRYGGDEQAPFANGEMVFTAPAQPLREGGVVPQAAERARAVEPPFAPKDSEHGPLMRISRRPPALARAADPANMSDAPGDRGEVERARPSRSTGAASSAGEMAITTNISHSSRPLTLSRRIDDQVGMAAENSAGELLRSSPPERVTESQAEQGMSRQSGSPLTETRVGDRVAAPVSAVQPALARSHELSPFGIARSETQIWRMPAASVTAGMRASSLAPAVGTEDQVYVAAPEKQKARQGEAVLPLAPAPPTIQRQAGGDEGGVQPPAGKTARAAERQPLAVTAEIPAAASQAPPHLIWRKSAAGGLASGGVAPGGTSFPAPPLPLKIEATSAGAPTLARKISGDSTTEPGSMTSLAPPLTLESSAPARGLDVAQLAEQVGRLLSRRLAVERERRGMK